MTKPRRHTPEQVAAARRVRDELRPLIEVTEEIRDQPGRMIRNPCGDPDNCQHGYCYGDPAEAEHVRQTGLPSDHGRH